MLHTIGHLLLHFGPTALAALVIYWMARRVGQLSQPERSRWLPLELALSDEDIRRDREVRARLATIPRWRRSLVMVTLALIFGIAIGIPVGTAIYAVQSVGGNGIDIHGDAH